MSLEEVLVAYLLLHRVQGLFWRSNLEETLLERTRRNFVNLHLCPELIEHGCYIETSTLNPLKRDPLVGGIFVRLDVVHALNFEFEANVYRPSGVDSDSEAIRLMRADEVSAVI